MTLDQPFDPNLKGSNKLSFFPLVSLFFGLLCSHLQEKKRVFSPFFLFLIVPGLQNEQKRFQLEELRKFGAQFKVSEVWESLGC